MDVDEVGSRVNMNVRSATLVAGAGTSLLGPYPKSELLLSGEAGTMSHSFLSDRDDYFFDLGLQLTLNEVPGELQEESQQAIGVMLFRFDKDEPMSSRAYVEESTFDRMKDVVLADLTEDRVKVVIWTEKPISDVKEWQRLLITGCEVRRTCGEGEVDA